ncbi:unnamed protein product [Schistosoma rodhaini]|nr:unnamed protein product [Schistosoma rodhaini]
MKLQILILFYHYNLYYCFIQIIIKSNQNFIYSISNLLIQSIIDYIYILLIIFIIIIIIIINTLNYQKIKQIFIIHLYNKCLPSITTNNTTNNIVSSISSSVIFFLQQSYDYYLNLFYLLKLCS